MSDLLQALPDLVAAKVRTVLPALRTCEGTEGRFNLERLKSKSIPAPAVLVSIIGLRQREGAAGPGHRFALDMTAFIVTRDVPALPRDRAAAAIAQAICTLVPDKRWGRVECGEAERVEAQPLVTRATDGAAASLWAVSWVQPCTLALAPVPEPIDPAVYLGQAPLIGEDHEDDYDLIGGEA